MDVKSTWILTWHQTEHVLWSLGSISKNRLLEVGPIQNRETMALRLLTTIDFLYLSCVNTHKNKEIIEIAFGWGLGHI